MGFLSSLFGGLGSALSGAGSSLMGGLGSLGNGVMSLFGGGGGGRSLRYICLAKRQTKGVIITVRITIIPHLMILLV